MLIDESKMAVDSSFSFLNLRKQHTILNQNFYFRLKHKPTNWAKSLHSHLLLNSYMSQPQIHKLGLTAYETNT